MAHLWATSDICVTAHTGCIGTCSNSQIKYKYLDFKVGDGKKILKKKVLLRARGIPTAAYQLLHLLPEVGNHLPGRVPPLTKSAGGYLRWGTPQQGTPQPDLPGGT